MHGIIQRTAIEVELLEIEHWLAANVKRTQKAKVRVTRNKRLTDSEKAQRLAELDANARAWRQELLQRRKEVITEMQRRGQSSPDNT